MARLKNANKLSSGFYQAHDFLRFDWKRSIKQMGNLQFIDRLGFPFPKLADSTVNDLDEQQKSDTAKQLNAYKSMCQQEYDEWINALKFQFEGGLLHDVIPPKAVLNDFFADLEVRMPHEQTLLIETSSYGITYMVRVEETTMRSWLRKYSGAKNLVELTGSKNEMQMWKYFDDSFKGLEKEGDEFVRKFPWYESLDQEVAALRLTVNCMVHENTIIEPDRFPKDHLEVMTKNISTMLPSTFFVPLGKTVGFYDKEAAIFMDTHFVDNDDKLQGAKDSSFHLACLFNNPLTTPGVYVRKDGVDKHQYPTMLDVDKIKHINNRHNGGNFNDATLAHYQNARQVFVHMGIMNHPEFKSLCVEKLKMDGIAPNKSPFSAARPYEARPGWRPPFEHYVVTINIPDDVSKESNASTMRKRHHLVRGHYMRTATKGFVWRKSHWRGNREMGVVTKDYVMDIDEKMRKQV